MKIKELILNLNFLFILSLFILAIPACNNTNSDSKDNLAIVKPEPLDYDNIKIAGELYTRAMRNFDRLEEEKYRPHNVFLTEEESGGWPGDTEGRTILGLTLESQATHRKALYLEDILKKIPQYLNEKGYMGPIYPGKVNEQQLSGNGWMLRGLCEYYSWKKDENILDIIKSITNLFIENKGKYKNYPIDPKLRNTNVGAASGTIQTTENQWMLSSDIGCVFIGMEGLIHAYKYIQTPEIKEVIDEMIDRFLEIDVIGIKAQTHATLTACRGLIRYAEITGDTHYIDEAAKRWEIYKNIGMTENHANYNWFGRFDTWNEPCAIVDSYMLAIQLWQHSGEFSYRNDAELIYYNALAHAQRANGGFGCDNCPGKAIHSSALKIIYDEAHWCCTMRGGEGLGAAVRYTAFVDDNKVFFPFYHTADFNIPLGNNKQILIKEQTNYPFDERISFFILDNTADMVSLMLPIPFWMDNVELRINDKLIPVDKKDSFIEVSYNFKKGDLIELEYTQSLRLSPPINLENATQEQKKIYSGPLLLAPNIYDQPMNINTVNDLESMGLSRFKVKGQSSILSPIYHLLNPIVSSDSIINYKRAILF